jgi:hypothetical protein
MFPCYALERRKDGVKCLVEEGVVLWREIDSNLT